MTVWVSCVSRTGRPLTMSAISSRLPRASWGGAIRPETANGPSLRSTSRSRPARSKPQSAPTRSRSVRARGAPRTVRPLCETRKWTSRCASAMASSRRAAAATSLGALLRNLRRAGVLKKRSCASTVVPAGAATSSFSFTVPPSPRTSVPVSAPRGHESSEKRVTAQMAGSASPRKPSVVMASRSSSAASLEVAWRRRARSTSSLDMPMPSSVTRISARPASRRSTVTWVASASSAFSTSSLATEAGRSTTSPAAILLTR